MFHEVVQAYGNLFDAIITGPLSDTKRIILGGFPTTPIKKDDLPAIHIRLGDSTKFETRPGNVIFLQDIYIHVVYNFEAFKGAFSYEGSKILNIDASENLSDKIGASYTCTEFQALNPQPRTALKEGTVLGTILNPDNINLQLNGNVVGVLDDTQGIDISFQNAVRGGVGGQFPTGEGIVRFSVRLSSRGCY